MPIEHVHAPRALRATSLPECFTKAMYSFAPYRGCGHGCRYCDGRAEKYYVEGDFERDIVVRENIPDLLSQELPALRDRGIISIGSGTTDAYQPCELQELVTARTIPLLAERGWPVLIITKSASVLRDLEAWRPVIARGGMTLLVSIVSTDETLRELVEPGASSFTERLETLAAFKATGATVGALAMPLLPGLCDDGDSMRRLFGALKEAGVAYAMPGGLTLRPGRQKDLFFRTLAGAHPELLPQYDKIFGENRASGAPIRTWNDEHRVKAAAALRDAGLLWTLPHREYRRYLPPHDALRVLYRDMIELYKSRGVPVGPLTAAAGRYDAWLLELRTRFRRRRSLPDSWLEDRVKNAFELGEHDAVLDNTKLARFSAEIVLGGKVFEFESMKLVDE